MIQLRHSSPFFLRLLLGLALMAGAGGGAHGGNVDHRELRKLLEPLSEEETTAAHKKSEQKATPAAAGDLGPVGTKVPRDLPASEIITDLRKILIEHYSLVDELSLAFARNFRGIRLPDEDYQVTITEYPEGGMKSSMVLRCKLTSGGALVGEWPLAVRAQLWRDVWVARDRIERGQVPDLSQLSTRKVDVLKEGEGLLSSSIDLKNFEMSEGVNEGRLLSRRDVSERPLVRKNQIVEVSVMQGSLSITMKALALESGAANTLIRLRNIDSRKEFSGKVIDERHVHALY